MARSNKKRARWVLRRQAERRFRTVEELYDMELARARARAANSKLWSKAKAEYMDEGLRATEFYLSQQEWDVIKQSQELNRGLNEDQQPEKEAIEEEREAASVASAEGSDEPAAYHREAV